VQARQSGFMGYYFHGAIENISFDNVALERLPKYHRLGIPDDICVSVRARKPVIGLCRRAAIRVQGILFSWDYTEHTVC
jgi:hypothetical protein